MANDVESGRSILRREFVKGAILGAIVVPQTLRSAQAQSGRDLIAYVGYSTTKERNARGEGIGVYRIDASSREWRQIQLLRDIVNPSYLAFDRTGRNLYAVHGDFGEASPYSIDPKTGEIAFLNKQDCGGTNPVHLTLDQSDRFMLVANYATGTLGALWRQVHAQHDHRRRLVEGPRSRISDRVLRRRRHCRISVPGEHRIARNPQRPIAALSEQMGRRNHVAGRPQALLPAQEAAGDFGNRKPSEQRDRASKLGVVFRAEETHDAYEIRQGKQLAKARSQGYSACASCATSRAWALAPWR